MANKKDRILISVVMPAYNRADMVGRAIDSVFTQEVDADVELLIGDNASTEDTWSVYEQYQQKYPGKITVFYREKNLGIGPNWAALVLACKGKYVCELDNDDFWHNPHKLQIQLDYMESHPDANILFTNFRVMNTNTGESFENYVRHIGTPIKDRDEFQKMLWNGEHGCYICTMMFRRDFVFANVSIQDFIDRRLPLQDWPFYVLLSEKTMFSFIPDSTTTLCMHGDSYTHHHTYDALSNKLRRDAVCMEYIYEKIPRLGSYDPIDIEFFINHKLLALAYTNNDYRNAHIFAKRTEYNSMKKKCAKTWLSFKLYVYLSRIKKYIKKK